ncbi:MAG: SDR family oxidoreductase [Proteobacteria bacterium]|nr:SDR family oxidoreductase [Pseudomonadota bacterium]
MNWPAGQTAFVTGAASGIGLGIARALVKAGAKVALADIDSQRVAAAARELADAGGEVIAVTLDVGDPDQWQAAADQAERALGPVSILCNNAGINGGGDLDQTTLDVWRWVYRVNVESQFIGISTFLPRFKQRGGRAHILNTGSMAGIVPMARVGAYSSAKFASVGLTMVLRNEVQGSDIGVSLLCPGTVSTRIAVTSGEGEAALRGTEVNAAAVEGNSALLSQGADPDRVGEQVVEAMQENQFLIITHKEWEPLVDAVHAEIKQAYVTFDGRHGPDVSAQALVDGFNPVTA